MLDMTLEQGHHVCLKALAGNNFSSESIRVYNADITQFVEYLQSVRVDWKVVSCDHLSPLEQGSVTIPTSTR
jgi:hypothetical protein